MENSVDLRYLIENEDLFEPAKIDEICGYIQDRKVQWNSGSIITESKSIILILFQKQLNANLEQTLSKQCHLEVRLRSVGKALNGLVLAEQNATTLNDMINHTAELAERVSAKVRRLDEARVSVTST